MEDHLKHRIIFITIGLILLMAVAFVIGYRMGFFHALSYEEPIITNITQLIQSAT